MRIGLLSSCIGNFGEKKYYNVQEVGLSKELDKFCTEVIVYKLVNLAHEYREESLKDARNTRIYYLPSKNLGANGIVDTALLDSSLDCLIYFSDTQISVTKVYRWAQKNNVVLMPYIGVIESHSTNYLKRCLININAKRNLNIYKKCTCLAKTPEVFTILKKRNVLKSILTPVGLDMNLLNVNYHSASIEDIKSDHGFNANHRIVLFIGRMVDEKRPILMLDIFGRLLEKDNNFRLVMVGTGPLEEGVKKTIRDRHLERYVKLYERVPNNEIWKLYCMAEVFYNLNSEEIFGMAILEAMFYECKVVAAAAPGPSFIIENGKTGWLANNREEFVQKAFEPLPDKGVPHRVIVKRFTWENTANAIKGMLSVRGE